MRDVETALLALLGPRAPFLEKKKPMNEFTLF